mgnify:CR=1 FL=1
MENAIRNAIIKFEQEFLGRGPDEVRALVARDLVVVRLKGVLTPAERQLAKTAEGIEMVKRLRQNLIAQGRDKLCEQIGEITGAKILGLFTDIDVQLGERNDAAAAEAEAAGLRVVMNRCPKIEYARLHGELSWNGINSQVISSKRRRL